MADEDKHGSNTVDPHDPYGIRRDLVRNVITEPLYSDILADPQALVSMQKYDGQHDGFFLQVVQQGKVSGPILITHSDKDQAVGTAYPLASRISGDTAAALGDANDQYGGIGRNGAQHMGDLAQELTLLPAQSAYALAAGRPIFNFNADNSITNHGDVARPETAWLMAMRILA